MPSKDISRRREVGRESWRRLHSPNATPRPRGSLAERFWPKVDRGEPDECWRWLATSRTDGYGHIKQGGARTPNLAAHRVAYELTVGPIPDGLCVCHTCDNRWCVNPGHLFLGTQADNMADMARKGRASRDHKRRLTDEHVREIRAIAGTVPFRVIADRYGITLQYAKDIAARRRRTAA